MNTKQEKIKKAVMQEQKQPPTLMAVQEKLGLFAPITPPDTQETHQNLTKKPLGYI